MSALYQKSGVVHVCVCVGGELDVKCLAQILTLSKLWPNWLSMCFGIPQTDLRNTMLPPIREIDVDSKNICTSVTGVCWLSHMTSQEPNHTFLTRHYQKSFAKFSKGVLGVFFSKEIDEHICSSACL